MRSATAATYPGEVWSFTTAGLRGRRRLRELHGQGRATRSSRPGSTASATTTNGSQVGYDARRPSPRRRSSTAASSRCRWPTTTPAAQLSEATADLRRRPRTGPPTASRACRCGSTASGQRADSCTSRSTTPRSSTTAMRRTSSESSGSRGTSTCRPSAASVNNVTKLTIGIEGAGATGKLYIDDIRLYPKAAGNAHAGGPGQDGPAGRVPVRQRGERHLRQRPSRHAPGQRPGRRQRAVLDGTDDAVAIPQLGGATATHKQCTYSMWMYSLTKPASFRDHGRDQLRQLVRRRDPLQALQRPGQCGHQRPGRRRPERHHHRRCRRVGPPGA